MVHWPITPAVKVECGSNIITGDCLTIKVMRPLNAVSYASILANDYQSKNLFAKVDQFDTLKVYMDYSDASNQVFEGVVEHVGPQKSMQGSLLNVQARGLGRAALLTHCNKAYGAESSNSAIDTPKEIWDDLVDNYINKSFGGAATGYSITKTYIESAATPTVNFLNSAYRSCFDLIRLVCELKQAERTHANASSVFFFDPSGNLRIKIVGDDQSGWRGYWRGSQADSTLVEGPDFKQFNCEKTSEEFANRLVYIGQLRKPAWDYWTENQSGLWGSNAHGTPTDDGATYKVGSYSLRLDGTPNQIAQMYYPSGQNANWNFNNIGSEQSVPTCNFWLLRNGDVGGTDSHVTVLLCTDAANYYYKHLRSELVNASEWYHFSFPIGQYHRMIGTGEPFQYEITGNPDWTNIDYIRFDVFGTAGTPAITVDDLHFSGKLVRVAYNSTNITSNNEVQAVIVDDTAHDDSMIAATDTGTCALLAYAELLRRQTTPIVGKLIIPGAHDLLPGQLIHLHAGKKSNGSYRINADYNVVSNELSFSPPPLGFQSVLTVTSDVKSSFPKTVASYASLLTKYSLLGNAEAKNLKAAGIDILVPQLTVDYPS